MITQFENENKPFKLTEKLRSEITEEEPMNEKIELTTAAVETVGPTRDRPKRPKVKPTNKFQARAERLTSLQSELRKHSDARKRTDLAIKDIQRQLKDILLVHHATIRDLQKQVTQIQRKISTIKNPKKHTSSGADGKIGTGEL